MHVLLGAYAFHRRGSSHKICKIAEMVAEFLAQSHRGRLPPPDGRLFAQQHSLLFMVKKIVDNAGGSIEVDSKVSVGTTFRVILPG